MEKLLKINVRSSDRKLFFDYEYDSGNFFHELVIPKKFLNSNRLNRSLAVIAILSRPINAETIILHDDLILDELTFIALSKTTQTKILCKKIVPTIFCDYSLRPDKLLLAFSGGFDSVCALALLEEEATLFSIDYLGWFKRERNFFEKFETDIFEWDIRQRKSGASVSFNESLDYRFLIAPAVLYAEEGLTGLITGTVLEASIYQYRSEKKKEFLKLLH